MATPTATLYFNDRARSLERDVPARRAPTFDNAYYVSAGHDESATWQEFGEMRFVDQNAVTDAFGPKHINPAFPRNWAAHALRAVDLVGGREQHLAERQRHGLDRGRELGHGVFAHELSHNLSLPDNYGNPFGTPTSRSAGGMWDMMSRGSFNGPGGQHTRWQVPPTQGASLGAQHGMRHKQKLGLRHQHRRAAAQP